MTNRPRIGVTGPDKGGFPAWFCTRVAVARAGGKAIRLRPGRFKDGQILPEIDGLVLGGGADVEPASPGDAASPEPADEAPRDSHLLGHVLSWLLAPLLAILRRLFSLSAGGVDRDRDHFEAQCLEAAMAGDRPVLGICRGAQFLNVRAGGTLHTELSGFYGEAGNLRSVAPRKHVSIARGTRLHHVLGDTAWVNSLHRQAVDQLGEGMVCAARDDSDVIQAIEHTGNAFMVGVQWHPEYLPAMQNQQRIFRELVNAARSDAQEIPRPIAARSRLRSTLGRLLTGGVLATLVLAGWLWWSLLSPFGYQPPADLPAIDPARTHHVFAYGSLRSAWVRRIAMGRSADPQPAVLPGYAREGSRNVRPAPEKETRGVVFGVSAEELRRLDRFERLGVRYERVETRLTDGRSAWLYRRLPEKADPRTPAHSE